MEQAFKVVGVAIAAAGAATAVFVKNSIDTADRMGKMSREIGISTETLSALSHQADLGGTNLETLSTGLQRLARNLSDAQNGLVTSKRAFADLGIEATDSKGNLRGVEEVLVDVADRFSKMEDGTKKTALAMELMGRGGVQLINTLNTLGEKGLAVVIKEARALGIVISRETAVAAEQFNDNLTRLSATSKGLGVILAAELLPTLNRVSNSFVDAAAGGEDFRDSAKGINKALLGLLTVHGVLATGIRELGMLWKTQGAIAINLFRGDFAGAVEAFKLGLSDMRQFGEVNMRGIREAWEEALGGIQTQSAKLTAATGALGTNLRKTGDAIQKVIAGLKEQVETFGLSERALLQRRLEQLKATAEEIKFALSLQGTLESQRALLDIQNALKDSTNNLSEALGTGTFSLEHLKLNSELMAEAIAKQNQEVLDATKLLNGLGIELNRTAKEAGLASDVGQRFTSSIASGFANLITRGGALSDVFRNLASQLAGMLLQIALFNTLKGIFGGIGILGFQHGGRPPVGRPALVGEVGPELFVPDRSGTIISNQALQSIPRAAGGKTVIIEQHFDFRGAGLGVMPEARRAIRLASKEIMDMTEARIVERSLRSA
jgi:hypothetical protein